MSNHLDPRLVGRWKLKGDCRDYSGRGNHGVNHAVNVDTGVFDGRDSYVEVPDAPSLNFGAGGFSISVWLYTERDIDDVIGDVLSKYDPERRKGFNLSIKASSGGYSSHGNDRHVYFGIDDARLTDWQDCGRPTEKSNYVSNSLTVFDGSLYAGTTDAHEKDDWCHVYRYEGGQGWADCGRVGNLKTTGVGPLIVHNGSLYAATWTNDWTRVNTGDYDPGHVYCYEGGMKWRDCGQPGSNRRLTCMASYKGDLYVGGRDSYTVYVYERGREWKPVVEFPRDGQRRCFPYAMSVHDGRLYVGCPGVYSYGGNGWVYNGTPVNCDQLHSLEVYRGKLYGGTWWEGKVALYRGGQDWDDCGRPGDSTEVQALTVYNGKFYIGSIPRAEVYRYEGNREWSRIKRFFSPEGWDPARPDYSLIDYGEGGREWTRVTSLTVYDGKLFAGIGSCTCSIQDAPCDIRGKVFCMEAGKCVSYDRDLGHGWKHIAAVKESGKLKLYVNGQLSAAKSSFNSDEYNVSNNKPLKIGAGEMDYFSGKIREVRLYNRILSDKEVKNLSDEGIKEDLQ